MSLTTTTLGRGRRVAAGSLIAVAALALTACQNGTDSASRSSSVSAPAPATSQDSGHGAQPSGNPPSGNNPRPSGSQGRSAQASGPSPHTPSAAQSHPSAMTVSDRCTADNMSLRLGRTDIGAGNIHIPLVFTNKGKTACSLRGFPGVSLILRDGSTVGKPATRSGSAGGTVRLQPGQSAHAVLHTVNDGVSDTPCWKKSQLVFVYPPGSKDSMTTSSGGLRVCGGAFDVTTVEAGSLG